METFKMYLDGASIAQKNVPDMSGFTEVLERDYALRGLVFKYPNGLRVFGDTFRYIADKFISDGFCGEISVRIERINNQGPNQTLKGIIFLSDVVFNWDECTAQISIEDDNYGARIANNINTKVNVLTTKTKNGQDINTVNVYRSIETYNPLDPALAYTSTCDGIDVFYAFNVVLEFITDNTVSFASDYLTDKAIDNTLLTTGLSLRTREPDTIEVSLADLLTTVARTNNLWWYVRDNLDGTYTLQMEPENVVFSNDTLTRFDYISGIEQSVFDEMLISGVGVGCEGRKELGTGTFALDYYRLFTHLNEEYYITGTCNIDTQLILTSNFIFDTNAIEDVVVNSNTDYDENLFLVQYDELSNKAVKYNFAKTTGASVPPYRYNEDYLNVNVLARYTYPNSLAQSYGDFDNTFLSKLSTDSAVLFASTTIGPLIFDDEITDPNNRYNPANGRYTAAGNGTYTFRVMVPFSLLSIANEGDQLQVTATWYKRDAATTVYESVQSTSDIIDGVNSTKPSELYQYEREYTTYLQANDTIEVHISFTVILNGTTGVCSFQYYRGAEFEAIAVFDGGGTYTPNDTKAYKAILLKFDGSIPDDTFKTIRNDKTGQITITRDGVTTMSGWIKRIERDFLTTSTTFELITNLDQINKIGI